MLRLRHQLVWRLLQQFAEATLAPTSEVKDNDSAYDINKKAARYARRNGRLLFKMVKPHQAAVMPVTADIT